jgi:hypothetical protein
MASLLADCHLWTIEGVCEGGLLNCLAICTAKYLDAQTDVNGRMLAVFSNMPSIIAFGITDFSIIHQ